MTIDARKLLEKHIKERPLEMDFGNGEVRFSDEPISTQAALAAIEEAVRQEREECAKTVELCQLNDAPDWRTGFLVMRDAMSAAIRSRGEGVGNEQNEQPFLHG